MTINTSLKNRLKKLGERWGGETFKDSVAEGKSKGDIREEIVSGQESIYDQLYRTGVSDTLSQMGVKEADENKAVNIVTDAYGKRVRELLKKYKPPKKEREVVDTSIKARLKAALNTIKNILNVKKIHKMRKSERDTDYEGRVSGTEYEITANIEKKLTPADRRNLVELGLSQIIVDAAHRGVAPEDSLFYFEFDDEGVPQGFMHKAGSPLDKAKKYLKSL